MVRFTLEVFCIDWVDSLGAPTQFVLDSSLTKTHHVLDDPGNIIF